MFDHVTVRAADLQQSAAFYRPLLAALEIKPNVDSDEYVEWEDFGLLDGSAEHPPTRHLHIAFTAPSHEHIDAFWKLGTEAGFKSDGEPGERPQYLDGYYGAFLLDPDGNSVEAVHLSDAASGPDGDGYIDHLWLGVSDLAAAERFYSTIAPDAGLSPRPGSPDRIGFSAGAARIALVADGRPVTEHLHIAFGASGRASVDRFHAAAMSAGYASNGDPGERPQYHPGYYGAFVFDPDGRNVEVVFHERP